MITISVGTTSGAIRVVCEKDRVEVEVDGGPRSASINVAGDRYTIHPSRQSKRLTVRCPEGSDVYCASTSGSITISGRAGRIGATAESGSIHIESGTQIDARSRSGSVHVTRCAGMCRLHAVSGSAAVDQAGQVDLASLSGSVRATLVTDARARCESGSITLGLAQGGRADARTRSGSVAITVPTGSSPALHLHRHRGPCDCDVLAGHDGEITAESASGTIRVSYR
jgi:DUF4097 and DUF4098 domain-containing protein YvlB